MNKNCDNRDEDEYFHDEEETRMINANDKKNFLLGRSAAVHYLWEIAEHTVCQKLMTV